MRLLQTHLSIGARLLEHPGERKSGKARLAYPAQGKVPAGRPSAGPEQGVWSDLQALTKCWEP